MKLLFISCLTILCCLNLARAEDLVPADLKSLVQKSSITNKESFLKKLSTQAQNYRLCPRLLFSLGIEKWNQLPEAEHEDTIKELAELAPFLRDSSSLPKNTSISEKN